MNAIVLIALRRPYTFVVMSILIVVLGGLTVLHMPTALLLEPRLSQDSPDIDALLRELRAAKPFLFEPALPARPAPSVMSPEPVPRDQLADLALEARASGSRLSLLNYLRARAARA